MGAINISRIPRCVRTPEGDGFADEISGIDIVVNNGKTDGYLTSEEFDAFRKSNAVSRWKSFNNFSELSRFVNEHVESQRCKPECKPPENVPLGDGMGNTCVAPPAPNFPPLPSPLKQKKEEKPDLSSYSLGDAPKWFDNPKPKPAPHRQPNKRAVPSLAELSVQQIPSPLKQFNDEAPNVDDPIVPSVKVSYDGKNFILEFHGCFIRSIEKPECVADWSYFMASVRNKSNGRTATREANSFGMVRVTVPAERGERVSAWGSDPTWGGMSLNRLHYLINEKGEVVFERNEWMENDDTVKMMELEKISKMSRASNPLSVTISSDGIDVSRLIIEIFKPDFWKAYKIYYNMAEESGAEKLDGGAESTNGMNGYLDGNSP